MEDVLYNEILYKNDMVEIYKTYDSEKQLYGLYMPYKECAKCLDATYIQIFPFATNGQAAAITDEGDYVWIGLDYNETKMKEGEQLVWFTYYASIASSAEFGNHNREAFMGFDDYTSKNNMMN